VARDAAFPRLSFAALTANMNEFCSLRSKCVQAHAAKRHLRFAGDDFGEGSTNRFWGRPMSFKRALAVSALSLGLVAANVAVFADAASAQERPANGNGTNRRNGGQPATGTRTATPAPRAVAPASAPRTVTPSPRAVQPAPQVARPASPSWRGHFGSRHAAPPPPPVRHAAPHNGHRYDPPRHRRGWGWRPWGYGAAAVGTAVIISSAVIAARPSDARACANDFEGFDWDTGTIINSDGDRVPCPYLE
jgi:hypothetical protein